MGLIVGDGNAPIENSTFLVEDGVFAWVGRQGEPLVYDGFMYVRHHNERYTAHDATTGDVIWGYDRRLPEEVMGWDVDTRPLWGFTPHRGRGMSLYGDKLIGHSTDGILFALDAWRGDLLWETPMTDLYRGQQPSGAPVVFDGMVVLGYDCSADSSLDPCHMSAYDAETGRRIWRWYTSLTPEDPMHYTWGDDPHVYSLEVRENMSPWMTPAIDTERGLVIFGGADLLDDAIGGTYDMGVWSRPRHPWECRMGAEWPVQPSAPGGGRGVRVRAAGSLSRKGINVQTSWRLL